MKTSLLLRLLIGLGLVGVRLAAAPAANTSDQTPTQAPPRAYTDGGTTSYDTTTTVYSYSNGGYNYGYNGLHSPGFNTYDSRIVVQHHPIYYPPMPPPLGEADFRQRARVSLARFAPPAALAEHVYEPFYAPLSTLLYTEDLSRKRRERLESYRASRTSLLTELRARLETLQNADAATREDSLAALAREQAPRLATLETAAAELRDNFTDGGFFESNVDWSDGRGYWRLGDNTRWESQLDEIKVMKGVAAFQDGLSPAERRLLRELTMELTDSLKNPMEEIALSTPGPFLYFSPETARIRLPAEIPAEVAAKIAAYKTEKAALKQELRDTLYRQDRAFFDYKRTNAFKALAEKQAGRFIVVEQLAEEIRRGLAPLPNPARPPALPLPAGLNARLLKYNQEKSALQTLLLARQEEVKNALPDDRVEFTRMSDTFVLSVIANRRSNPAQDAKRQAIVESLVSFNQEQTTRYSALAREKEAIRAEVMRAANDLSGKKSIDQLLREFAYAFKKQETWELYHDYEIAVLEPGLSPAQRVLLFGAALEKLDLPLSN